MNNRLEAFRETIRRNGSFSDRLLPDGELLCPLRGCEAAIRTDADGGFTCAGGHDESALVGAVADEIEIEIDEIDAKAECSAPSPGLLMLADVEHRRVSWLWHGRIPAGKVTVLDGDPGLGKSTLTLDLAARVTRGGVMPDDSQGVKGAVLLLSAEDDAGDTIAPRFEAAGGVPALCGLLTSVSIIEGVRPWEFPTDADLLEERVREIGAKLIVIDPLMAYLADDVKSSSDHKIRRALAPLKDVAERTGAAVVLVRHLNKDRKNGTATYRGGGSIGIIGAARAGLLVARDPEDDERRVLAVSKANLAPQNSTGSLSFRIASAPNGVGVVEWLGDSQHSADDLVRPADADDGALGQAVEFLREQLADGPMLARDINAGAKVAGISESTLKRARTSLGVVAEKRFDGKWQASLPERAR